MWVVMAAVLASGLTVYGDEYHFRTQASKAGCDSIITEAGQNACKSVQDAKNKACSQPVHCDVKEQTQLIEDYKKAKAQLESGEVNDSDKEKLEESVKVMRQTLDQNREDAHAGIPVAQGCVDGRKAVQTWFANDGVTLTVETRDEALKERQGLLDALTDAEAASRR